MYHSQYKIEKFKDVDPTYTVFQNKKLSIVQVCYQHGKLTCMFLVILTYGHASKQTLAKLKFNDSRTAFLNVEFSRRAITSKGSTSKKTALTRALNKEVFSVYSSL